MLSGNDGRTGVDVVGGIGRSGAVLTGVALLVLVVGGALLATGLSRRPAPPAVDHHGTAHRAAEPRAVPRHRQAPHASGARQRGVPDLTTGPVLPVSRPVRVSIPRLGVASRLERLGVDGAGAMDVPVDPAQAGWYTLGPAPGSLGPAVITGHVTWNGTRAVFFRLATLRPGDLVKVDRADGRTAVFRVRRVARFQKTHFPTRAVFGAIDRAALRLITCGGTYDAAAHRYLANVVVFATLVSAR